MKINEIIAYKSFDLVVHKNPTFSQFERMQAAVDNSHGEGLRGIVIGNDLYVWDGYYANHDEVKTHIGVDGLCVHLWGAYVEADINYVSSTIHLDDEDDREAVGKVAAEIVRNCAAINRVYGENVTIKISDGYEDWWA